MHVDRIHVCAEARYVLDEIVPLVGDGVIESGSPRPIHGVDSGTPGDKKVGDFDATLSSSPDQPREPITVTGVG